MIILTINSGSSSLKYSIYQMENRKILAKGLVERIGLSNPHISHNSEAKEIKEQIKCNNHEDAISYVLNFFNLHEVDAVAHRVVHGGERFQKEVIIDTKVESEIENLSELAPLHNPANLIGIRACQKMLPDIPHVAIFDTSFHNTIPEYAFRYAIPAKWHIEKSFRRYGFHGTSVEFVTSRTIEILGLENSRRIIVLHLGNGASITAVRNGESIDTSMGLTPLEGLIMGTRSGDIDPGLILAMMRSQKMSVDQIDQELNTKSGLLGITGKFRDMREIQINAQEGNSAAQLAIQMAVYRIQKYIGAYFVALGGLDAIVFTGGIGERSSYFRNSIVKGLGSLGILLDHSKNKTSDGEEEEIISSLESKTQVLVIPTNEEYMMALKTLKLLAIESK
ncbi:acetate kinase [Candidatus Heimdallarchaeota archaeon B3_Heim]|nr:MAG: acetate kinase [Candidatus Heimdallarchaeota archaeon B3_Heim]